MDKLIDGARFAPDDATYDADVKGFLQMGMDQVPMVAICQPFHDVAMQKYMSGYTYMPCREPDFRFLVKGA
jgi:peptide/nickel transport system substrate-binding protein